MEDEQGVVVTEQAADAQGTPETIEERSLPVNVVKSIRDELKRYKAEVETLRAQQIQPQTTPKPAEEKKSPLDGMSDEELITVQDVKRILSAQSGNSAQLTTKLQHLEFAVDHPDYKEAITQLGESLKTDPTLAAQIQADIKQSGNPLLTAYNYAKLVNREPKKQSTANQIDIMADLERILENKSKPGSPAQVQGSGGGAASKAERIKAMTPEEFDAHVSKIING